MKKDELSKDVDRGIDSRLLFVIKTSDDKQNIFLYLSNSSFIMSIS